MPVPHPRCIICDAVITEWTAQKGQKPKYCLSNPECRAKGRADPICGRCKEPLTMEHYSQRYHEDCALGCHVCGKPLRTRAQSEPGAGHLQPIYCSVECQEHAWEGSKLPICRKCKKPVPLPKPPRSLRNPPKMHQECRPTTARLSAEQMEEHKRQAAKEAAKTKTKPKSTVRKDTRKAPWDE